MEGKSARVIDQDGGSSTHLEEVLERVQRYISAWGEVKTESDTRLRQRNTKKNIDSHLVRVRRGEDAEHDSHQGASQRKGPLLAEPLDLHEPCTESDAWETNAGLDL